MQLARKNVTYDPFVMYEFYETLAKEVEHLGISDNPEAFYNCDESGFPADPSKCKYTGPIGKKNHSGYSWSQQREPDSFSCMFSRW